MPNYISRDAIPNSGHFGMLDLAFHVLEWPVTQQLLRWYIRQTQRYMAEVLNRSGISCFMRFAERVALCVCVQVAGDSEKCIIVSSKFLLASLEQLNIVCLTGDT